MTTHRRPGPLGGLTVLDLGGMRTAYAARLMADMGADVVLVEPPDGDPARRMPPFAGDQPGPERSLVHLAFNTNKRSAVLDLSDDADRDRLLDLAAGADAVFEGFHPGYLDSLGLGYAALAERNPGLVLCSVTPFGQTGPYTSYQGSDLHVEAMGGLMTIQGAADRAPCMSPAFLGYSLPGVHAALGVLHALHARQATAGGLGQHVEVSMQEVVANIHFIVSQYGYNATPQSRPGIGSGGATGIFDCRDGSVGFSPITPGQWKALVEWMDEPVLRDPVLETFVGRREQADLIHGLVTTFLARFDVADFVEQAQARRIPAAPVSTPAGLATNPHLLDRRYFIDLEHPATGSYRLPGALAQLSETPWGVARPAPRLGEHTDEVLAAAKPSPAPTTPTAPSTSPQAPLPLGGIRIVDLTRIWVGPYCTRQLADFGADVVKVESTLFDQNSRAGGILPTHADLSRNKRSITLDLHTPGGQEVIKRLVAESDALVENYAAGTLSRWGLGYDDLRHINPDLVYLSMPGWGSVGPYADHVLFGLQAQTASGVSYLWGYPDAPPRDRCGIYYADFFVGSQAAFVLEAALLHRRSTGRGQFIEISQVEAMANAMAVPFLDHAVNGRDVQPAGNDRAYAAPHGVYPCAGDDRWVAIACETDAQWAGFAAALTPHAPPGARPPEWTLDERFRTFEGRAAHRDALNAHITTWTADLTPKQVMFTLQRHSVPAAAVQDSEDIFFDPHLRSRGYIQPIEHPEPVWGKVHHAMFTAHLPRNPAAVRLPAPALGAHTREVLTQLAGYSEEDIQRLADSGALT